MLVNTIATRRVIWRAEGSRAVWTGEAVLIATPLGREVALRRYECGRGGFHRTDHE